MTIRVLTCILLMAVFSGGTPASAQNLDMVGSPEVPRQSEEAIVVGPFLMSPALELTWQSRDNIFFAPPPYEVEDQVYLAKTRLMFEIPVFDEYIRFNYTLQARDYKDYPFKEVVGTYYSHFFDVSGGFEFPNGLRLTTGYKFVTADLENREVDPGGELMWGERRYKKHHLQAVADYWFSPRDGLTIEGYFSDLNYEVAPTFPDSPSDYSELVGGIGWLHQINPTTVLGVIYNRGEYKSNDEFDARNSVSDSINLSLRGQLTAVLASDLRVGWRRTDYKVPQNPSLAVDNYESWTASGGLNYRLAHGSSFRLDVVRSNYPSYFGTNAYYTATGGSLMYNLERERLTGQVRVRLQNNDYEVPDYLTGEKRSDDITTWGLGLTYRLTDFISLRGAYLYEKRDTLYRYSYEANMISLGLLIGY